MTDFQNAKLISEARGLWERLYELSPQAYLAHEKERHPFGYRVSMIRFKASQRLMRRLKKFDPNGERSGRQWRKYVLEFDNGLDKN